MDVLHAKQQNVLRLKMEDALAVTKRLKEALCLHSSKSNCKSSSSAISSENDQQVAHLDPFSPACPESNLE
jgi:hypothetical protein